MSCQARTRTCKRRGVDAFSPLSPQEVPLQAHATHSAAGTRQRIVAEPRWRSLERYTTRSLPPATRAWLTDDGSLTARLVALDQGPFRVQRLARRRRLLRRLGG